MEIIIENVDFSESRTPPEDLIDLIKGLIFSQNVKFTNITKRVV